MLFPRHEELSEDPIAEVEEAHAKNANVKHVQVQDEEAEQKTIPKLPDTI